MERLILAILLLLPAYFSSEFSYTEDVLVVVHQSVEVEDISKSDLLDLYTLRKGYWGDGDAVYVADYKGKSTLRNEFYDYLGIRLDAIKRIWLKEQFTGNSLPPRVVKNTDEMIELVLENPGTIGYIPRSKLTDELKVVKEIRVD